jgi:predicted nucleotidyltransferase
MAGKASCLVKEDRKYGILIGDLSSIVSILSANPRIDRVILFGSRAKGNYYPGSDIDIAVKGQLLNLDDILESLSKIDKLSLPYRVDLVIYDRINEPDLISHIDRVGISLFER